MEPVSVDGDKFSTAGRSAIPPDTSDSKSDKKNDEKAADLQINIVNSCSDTAEAQNSSKLPKNMCFLYRIKKAR